MFYLVYMNVGPDSGAYLTIAITPSTTTTSTSRTWEIKVSQFLCKDRDLYVYHKVLCKNVLSINIRNCSFKKGHHRDVCNGLSDIPEDGRLSTLMLPQQLPDNTLLLKGKNLIQLLANSSHPYDNKYSLSVVTNAISQEPVQQFCSNFF